MPIGWWKWLKLLEKNNLSENKNMTNAERPIENSVQPESQKNIEKYAPAIHEVVAEYFAAQKRANIEGGRPLKGMTFDNPTKSAVEAVISGAFEIRSVHVNQFSEDPEIRVSVAPNAELVITGTWAYTIIERAGV